MEIKIERDGQTWVFDVMMGMETLTAKLRAYYNGPAPEPYKPFDVLAPRVSTVAAEFWHSNGEGNMRREDVPTPHTLAGDVRTAIADRTYVMGVGT